MPIPHCPRCGGELAEGPCPRCPDETVALGAAPTPGLPGETLPPAGRPGSVLETLAATVGAVPQVLLREIAAGGAPGPIPRPWPDPRNGTSRYRIDGEIARGGMGAVLRGRDPDLGRDVAIKVLRDDLRGDADLVRRFVEEAQIGGQLQHPGVVPIYELGAFGDHRPYFAMKLVRGQTLAEQLAARPAPSDDLPRFLATFAAVAQTMAYAHARGVIHRDLKPSNIMVGSFGEVQVMDWGLAKVLGRGGSADAREGERAGGEGGRIDTSWSDSDAALSQAGSVLGTPSYMPPEQARGEVARVDERADVFALGSILAEILTGSPAYTGRTAREILARAAKGDAAGAFARLDACGAEADLIALARDCLSASPDGRPRDATVVAGRITGYLDGVQERVQAAIRDRAVAEARAVEERRRRRLQLGLAAAVLGLVGLGAGGFAWAQRQRADRLVRAASQIDDALAEAQRLRGEAGSAGVEAAPARWALALAAAERAAGHVARGDADEFRAARAATLRRDLRAALQAADDRLARRRVDLKLLASLGAARFAMAENQQDAGFEYDSASPAARAGLESSYARAFREAGLDLDKAGPGAAGAWIAGRSEPADLITFLDDWAATRRGLYRPRAEVDRLVAAARAADSDPWRNALRTRLVQRAGNGDAVLNALADDPGLDQQSAPNLVLLASQIPLNQSGVRLKVLRQAQVRFPNDYWVNLALATTWKYATALGASGRAEGLAEVVRYYSLAAAARPGSSVVRCHLGWALQELGRSDEAFDTFREAVRLGPDDAWAHDILGSFLDLRGKPAEALGEVRRAIQINPDVATFHASLGKILERQGRPGEAIAAYREAVRLDPDRPDWTARLAGLLEREGRAGEAAAIRAGSGRIPDELRRSNEAIAEAREAVRLDPGHAGARDRLGHALLDQGHFDEAAAAFREAIRLDPGLGSPHSGLGIALLRRGRDDEAGAQFREAVRIDPASPLFLRNLAAQLRIRGDYAGSLDAYRKALALAPGDADLARSIAGVERMARLAGRLPGVLAGTDRPGSGEERADLARMAAIAKHPAASARLYAEAMEIDPKLGEDLGAGQRQLAAGAAAWAGTGGGADDPPPGEARKAELRGQALRWLRADLEAWAGVLGGGPGSLRASLPRRLRQWMVNPDLAGVRDAEGLAKLPGAEREAWRAFWADVDALLRKAGVVKP